MAKIQILSKVVADQIAAGEVVERPASVVKELVENSLDAGATRVQVEIDGGGTGRIRVLDDGAGIGPDDVEHAFLRHATSKIRQIEDLMSVRSFGFRGEALSSIAAVSRIRLQTRTADRIAGIRLDAEGGDIREQRETGCPVGTDFEVRDLFYNVPARLKFLKREGTEASHCIEAVVRLAMVRPDVAFRVVSNGRNVRSFLPVDNRHHRVQELYRDETLAHAVGEEDGVHVEVVLGPPERARAGAGSLYTYVNGRFIRDKALLRAVSQAFGGILENGRYPAGMIAISVVPEAFDVNVHPQKTEVRFVDPQAVFRSVSRVVGAMVARSPWACSPGVERVSATDDAAKEAMEPWQAESVSSVLRSTPGGRMPTMPDRNVRAPVSSVVTASGRLENRPLFGIREGSVPTVPTVPMVPPGVQTDESTGPFSSMRYIGQAAGTYLILEDGADLILMDQHAAHERVTYETLRRQLSSGHVASQRLLVPHAIDLGPAETDRIMGLQAELSRMGIDVEQTFSDRIAVHAVPAVAAGSSPDRLLAEMVLALESGREQSMGEKEDRVLATIACHASVRAGRSMDSREVFALLTRMDDIDFAGHCPHGRPVLTRIPFIDIGRRMGRHSS